LEIQSHQYGGLPQKDCQSICRLFLNSVNDDSFIPWRMCYKMLEWLIRAFSNLLCESAAIASISI
jgi:hypothetical protein